VRTSIVKIRTHLTAAVFAVLSLGLASTNAAAADQSLEYGVKAAFLAKFGLFVEWPETTFSSPNQSFLLCVLGDDPFGSAFDKISGQQAVKGRRIEVRRLKTVSKDNNCQILYVATSEAPRVGQILESLRGSSTLTVTDGRSATEPAGMINFVIKDDRVRFDIDEEMAAQNGLFISSTLLGLAVNVKRRQSREVR
jgi:hypothetical protein